MDESNSKSLYLLAGSVDSQGGTLYEYGPGDERPRSTRSVDEISDPWMDAAGNLYVRRPPVGIFRYDATTWARKRIYRGDDDDFVVDAKGTLYLAVAGAAATVSAGSTRPLRGASVHNAGIQSIAVDARGRAYVATMPDGHIRVYDDLRRPPIRVIAAPRGLRTMALDARGRLFGLGDTGDELYEYANAMAKPLVVTEGLTDARQIAFDRKGNVYVLNEASHDGAGGADGRGSVVEFADGVPDYTRTIPIDDPLSIAVDDAGDLFVSLGREDGSFALYVYGPEGTEPIRRFNAIAGALFFGTPTGPHERSRQPKPSAERGGSTE